jgi:hypothetical protein
VEITKLFGLPAHPLIVHVPIVLLPLCAAGVVAMAVSAGMRDRIGWIVAVLAGIALLGVQLAMDSGEPLREGVPHTAALREHIHLADTVRPLAALLLVGVVVIMLLHQRANRRSDTAGASVLDAPWLRVSALAVTLVVALVTTVQLARVGHNGARATWQKVKVEAEHGEGDEGG